MKRVAVTECCESDQVTHLKLDSLILILVLDGKLERQSGREVDRVQHPEEDGILLASLEA